MKIFSGGIIMKQRSIRMFVLAVYLCAIIAPMAAVVVDASEIQTCHNHIFDTDGKCSVCKVQAEAKIGVNYYIELAEAVSNWTSGSTLILMSDVTDLDSSIVLTGKNLTLDLNGKILREDLGDSAILVGKVNDFGSTASLTIRDSKGKGAVYGSYAAITVYGTLKLESGALYGDVYGVQNEGYFSMTGGSVEASMEYGVGVENYGTVNVQGGTVKGADGLGNMANLSVSGGVITGISGMYNFGTASISGGKFTGEFAIRTNKGSLTISGNPFVSGNKVDFYVTKPIIFASKPGEIYTVFMENSYIGAFAVPGEGTVLTEDMFVSLVEGYIVDQQEDGILILSACDHKTEDFTYNVNDTNAEMHDKRCKICALVQTESHEFGQNGLCVECGTGSPESIEAPVLKATNVASTGKIQLSWNAVEGAAKYKLYRSADNKTWTRLTTTTSTTATNTQINAGEKYYYYVTAVDEKGNESEASNVVARMCDLARPTLTLSNVASTGKIQLSWTAVDGAVKYQIQRSLDNKTWEHLAYTTNTTATNTKAEAGVTYYYKVRAIGENSAANSAYSSVKSRMCDLARPTLSITLNSAGKPKLSWNAIDGAVKYQIVRSTDNKNWEHLAYTTNTTATNTKAVAGTKYYYKVRVIAENTAANSAYSAVKRVTAK